ncbi:MAG: hypothetical protein WCG02_00410 [Candidatus Taylorbacteria bacterium]
MHAKMNRQEAALYDRLRPTDIWRTPAHTVSNRERKLELIATMKAKRDHWSSRFVRWLRTRFQ